jgi:hypothetical protein
MDVGIRRRISTKENKGKNRRNSIDKFDRTSVGVSFIFLATDHGGNMQLLLIHGFSF